MKRYSSPIAILIATCALFLFLGIFNAGLGPVLAELSSQTGVTLAAVGAIFTALFLGALIANLAAGPLSDRFGRKVVLIAGVVVIGVGIFSFTLSNSFPLLLGLVFIAGLGQGSLDLSANLVVADAYPKNNLAALNVLHFFFGLGSSVGPALISLSLLRFNRGIFVIQGSSIGFLVVAGLLFFISFIPPQSIKAPEVLGNESKGKSIYLSSQLWLLSLLLLVAVGMELGLGSWATIYMQKTTELSVESAALVTSGYWAFLTVGRLISAFLSRRLTREKMLVINLGGAVVGGVAFALSNGRLIPSIVSMLFTGMCFGGLYALVISLTSAAFRTNTGKATGIVVAAGSVGGLAFPWIAGLILNKINSQIYAWFIAVFVTSMFVIQFFIRRQKRSFAVSKEIPAES